MNDKLKQALDEAAEKALWNFTAGGTPAEENHFIKGFEAGATWLLEYLGKDVGEFNEDTAIAMALDHNNDEIGFTKSNRSFIKGARWQFEQDKARIGLAEKKSKP